MLEKTLDKQPPPHEHKKETMQKPVCVIVQVQQQASFLVVGSLCVENDTIDKKLCAARDHILQPLTTQYSCLKCQAPACGWTLCGAVMDIARMEGHLLNGTFPFREALASEYARSLCVEKKKFPAASEAMVVTAVPVCGIGSCGKQIRREMVSGARHSSVHVSHREGNSRAPSRCALGAGPSVVSGRS